MRYVSNLNELPDFKEYKILLALLGDRPSKYSRSANGWNHLMLKLGIDGIYVPLDVPPENFGGFFEDFSKIPNLRGLNVTTSHKKRVINCLGGIDEYARRADAVNAVAYMIGHNTDGKAELLSLEKQFGSIRGFHVLGIGAGGAAGAVYDALLERIDWLYIANRTPENSKNTAENLRKYHPKRNIECVGAEEIRKVSRGVDLILNTTSIGNVGALEGYSCLAPTDIPISQNNQISLEIVSSVPSEVIFADLVFNPGKTAFLEDGEVTGHKIQNGFDMLVNQAALGAKEYMLKKELNGVPLEAVSNLLREGVLIKDINEWKKWVG